ncbi:MAG: hypothetical protein WD750_05845 [Gammaproteobacteria bacterium]
MHDTNERALALYYAYTALVKTLSDDGVLEMDHLFSNLSGATHQLKRIGEDGAADALGAIAESLTAI